MINCRQWNLRTLAILVTALPMMGVYAGEIRNDGVIFLSDMNQPPLHLKALRRTPITASRDSQSVIAYLAPGQSVEIVGLGEIQHEIKARTATGFVDGWVDGKALQAPPAALLAKLKQRRERVKAHQDLIERHEATVGMTRAEVHASLGKPDRKAQVHTKLGDEEQWFYTYYKYTPHYEPHQDERGRSSQKVSYRRVPAGHKIITFQQDEVVEIGDDQPADEKLPETGAPVPAGH